MHEKILDTTVDNWIPTAIDICPYFLLNPYDECNFPISIKIDVPKLGSNMVIWLTAYLQVLFYFWADTVEQLNGGFVFAHHHQVNWSVSS